MWYWRSTFGNSGASEMYPVSGNYCVNWTTIPSVYQLSRRAIDNRGEHVPFFWNRQISPILTYLLLLERRRQLQLLCMYMNKSAAALVRQLWLWHVAFNASSFCNYSDISNKTPWQDVLTIGFGDADWSSYRNDSSPGRRLSDHAGTTASVYIHQYFLFTMVVWYR